MGKLKFIVNPLNGELIPIEVAAAAVTGGNIDGGNASSIYLISQRIDGGNAASW